MNATSGLMMTSVLGEVQPMEQAVQQKWEYLVEETNSVTALRETLARLGRQGWELVNVSRGSTADATGPVKSLRVRKGESYCLFLKRPEF
jgi:hypothetical protein